MSSKAHTKSICLQLIPLIIVAFMVTSCGSGRQVLSGRKKSVATNLQDDLVHHSKKYLGKPYRYAARGPYAFDCSGFTSFVFRQFGYHLEAGSETQERQFPAVEPKEALQKGDLVFFEGRSRNGVVGHVGIVTEVRANGEFRFIHASTNYGVVISSSNEPYYAARYLHGGRVLEESAPVSAPKERNNRTRANAPTIARAGTAACQMDAPVAQRDDEVVILVQSDPLKNRSAGAPRTGEEKRDTQNRTVTQANNNAILREETGTVPEPVVTDPEEGRMVRHTVKSGETLFSIGRKYGCTTHQLRAWNPQLGKVLQAGETLNIRVNP
ncbi:MAG: NlpC/P60 family protein [Proteiniphilum sp.]|nr:NlpC/P60 family protein [Proteiniphilum sp.]